MIYIFNGKLVIGLYKELLKIKKIRRNDILENWVKDRNRFFIEVVIWVVRKMEGKKCLILLVIWENKLKLYVIC